MSRTRALPFKCSAVVSDVDGTLVTDNKTLSARARAAVASCGQAGSLFRSSVHGPPRGMCMLFEPLGITTPVSGFNGGVVARPDLAILTEHLLSPDTARRAIDMLDAHQCARMGFQRTDWFVRGSGGPYAGLEERTVGFGPTVVADFGPALDAAAKIVGVSRDFALLAECENNVRTELADNAFVARSQPYYLDITHALANKGAALSEIAKLLRVPLAEIAVIGDGGNDVAMFERSGLSIAMGNASPEVQQAADFVTDSNREEGFANAIERFILGGALSGARGRRDPFGGLRMKNPTASKISLVLADVDGTLVTSEKVLTPRAAAAVKALHIAESPLRSPAADRRAAWRC